MEPVEEAVVAQSDFAALAVQQEQDEWLPVARHRVKVGTTQGKEKMRPRNQYQVGEVPAPLTHEEVELLLPATLVEFGGKHLGACVAAGPRAFVLQGCGDDAGHM